LGPKALKSTVFAGYAENSKTYKLLDSNIIVESRDVQFCDNKFLKDLMPSSASINGKEVFQDAKHSSSNKRKVNGSPIEPRKNQR
jgi:hypothetical protein